MEEKHGVGNMYRHMPLSKVFILACVSYKRVVLISLHSGHRWSEVVKVDNVKKLTRKEWGRVVNYSPNFRKVTKAELKTTVELPEYIQQIIR